MTTQVVDDYYEMLKETKTEDILLLEYAWLTARAIRGSLTSQEADYDSRMSGQYADALVLYVMTGVLKEPPTSFYEYDLVPCMNLFRIAPPHVRDLIEPIISEWKGKFFKSPDLTTPTKTDELEAFNYDHHGHSAMWIG